MSNAEEFAVKRFPHDEYSGTEGDTVRYACILGYFRAEADMLERAVAWLKENWRDYVWTTDNGIPHFGHWEDDFRKAMEG